MNGKCGRTAAPKVQFRAAFRARASVWVGANCMCTAQILKGGLLKSGGRNPLPGYAPSADRNRTALHLYMCNLPSRMSVLRPLAPIMASRGDTFTIRAYGETINPSTGKPDGQAWCEAVIQRIPNYLNKIDNPWKSPADEDFNEVNKTFGRQFKIVGFRWLSEADIS